MTPQRPEAELVAAARRGDERAYRALMERYRGELHAHAYRMLGSVHDAEDAMQDALLRAWRGLPRFDGRSALRSWLYRIVTNTCLDLINKRPKKVLPIEHGPPSDAHDGPGLPLTESIWIEPYPDDQLGLMDGRATPEARYEQRESVELAFVAITMPPMASWFRGEGVEIFLREWAFSGRVYDAEGRRNVRVLPAQANGQPAIGTYSWSDDAGAHLPTVLQVLTFEGEKITEITGFVDPSAFARFGLPERL